MAPALAANSCWFGAPGGLPAALPACSDPEVSLDLFGRFHLKLITLPTQGAGTIGLALAKSNELIGVDVNFIPPLEVAGLGAPLSGAFEYQIAIAPDDTDYFSSASLSISPSPSDPDPSFEPAAITLVQAIPEANESLDAADHPWVSLYRDPDPLKSITLQSQFTLTSGYLSTIHNGFGIFVFDPPEPEPEPEPEPVPGPLPFGGAAIALACSRGLRWRLRSGVSARRPDSPGAGPVSRASALGPHRRQGRPMVAPGLQVMEGYLEHWRAVAG